MKSNRLSQINNFVLCVVLTALGVTVGEQLLANYRWKSHFGKVLAQSSQEQIAKQIYQKASPAVVTVKTEESTGSGFVVSKDGYILTNTHVIKPPPRYERPENYNPRNFPNVVTVEFPDGKQFSADVMGFGKDGLDLAILKIHGQKNLPTLSLASSSVQRGERVFALGSPLGGEYKDTFTQGDVTNINSRDGQIQHSAVVLPGNSGGPLLNSQAQVIGVNTSGVGELNVGMNFAIPASKVQSFITAAKKGDVSPVSTLVKPEKQPEFHTISLNGQVISASLTKDDYVRNDNGYIKLYQFKGKAGQKVVIEMTSQKLNPFLTLYKVADQDNSSKQIAENDDRGAGDFNAQINTTLPENGDYIIEARASDAGQTGNFSLRVSAQP
ncbi:serine protease [Calothrix sp. NIES-4071]|nr:serine protease [Calothrix sp. NIES-4071]BAZ59379.1 serine protease [Calothrix sp. NIES-4105]